LGKAEPMLVVKERKAFSSIPKPLLMAKSGRAKKPGSVRRMPCAQHAAKLNKEKIKVKREKLENLTWFQVSIKCCRAFRWVNAS
jgi:hypothetical protein